MDIKHKNISSQSARVLTHFAFLNQPAFVMQEAAEVLYDSSREAVKKLMRDMVDRGLLLRLKDGVYWIVPYERDAASYFPNHHLVAKYLVNNANYYIGYYSALEIHNLITQPSMLEQIVVNKQIKPAKMRISGQRFQFIYHNAAHFFGVRQIWVDDYHQAPCSDLEKTFVDCLYKPDYAGGITEIAKALFKSKDNINYEKLLDYCKKFKAQSVIKRLGFLLDLLRIGHSIEAQLYDLITPSIILLEPSYEKRGKLINKWSLQQNLETEDITGPIFT